MKRGEEDVEEGKSVGGSKVLREIWLSSYTCTCPIWKFSLIFLETPTWEGSMERIKGEISEPKESYHEK